MPNTCAICFKIPIQVGLGIKEKSNKTREYLKNSKTREVACALSGHYILVPTHLDLLQSITIIQLGIYMSTSISAGITNLSHFTTF